jgi:sugar phosphate isomerase/epimerase
MNPKSFQLSLNTSTIRGAKLPLTEEIKIAAQAGFTGIEPWIEEIEAHQKTGGSLKDLKKQIADNGLQVVGAVGFAEWIIADNKQRAAGLERMKHDMDLVHQIGGHHIATPPIGAHLPEHHKPTLAEAAERYATILDLGQKTGVIPILELWGFSHYLNRLSEVAHVAIAAKHPQACLLLDSYHLYKGGSDFESIRLLNGAALPVFHINDYPADPPRDRIDDSYRVYPGDGVAPLTKILQTFKQIGFKGFLSVELFNETYWRQPALGVAQTCVAKTNAVIQRALAAG